ncbi:MAG: SPOR domain-containing protein [Rhizobiaceae bacterium]|nr:SPOR domain-containing protein [Rhizobiaceae bacterium]
MAEASWLRKSAPVADSEDDPFAELTKIMGFDPRVPVRSERAANDPQDVMHQRVAAPNVDVHEDDLDLSIDLERELMGVLEPEIAAGAVDTGPYSGSPHDAYPPQQHAPVADADRMQQDDAAYADWPAEDGGSEDYAEDAQARYAEPQTVAYERYEAPVADAASASYHGTYESEPAGDAYAHQQQAVDDIDLVAHLDEELVASFEDEPDAPMSDDDQFYRSDEPAAYSEPRYVQAAPDEELDRDFDAALADVDMNFAAQAGGMSAEEPGAAHLPFAEQEAASAEDYGTYEEADRYESESGFDHGTTLEDEMGSALADELDAVVSRGMDDAEVYNQSYQAAPPVAEPYENGPQDVPAGPEVSEYEAEQSEIDDAIAELAAMVRGYDNREPVNVAGGSEAAAFAPPANAVHDIPDIETVDVPEAAVALADDLDIPEVDYTEEPSPQFDDLDAELAAAFGEPAIEPVQQPAAASIAVEDIDLNEGYQSDYGHAALHGAAAYAVASGAVATARHAAKSPVSDPFDEREGYVRQPRGESYPFQVNSDDLEEELSLDDDFAPIRQREPQRRGMIVAAVVGGIAVLGAVGAYALSGGDGVSAGGPALVKADTDPVKVRPENPGGAVVPNQNSGVFERAAGEPAGQPQQQELISDAEEPVDVAARFPDTLPQPVDETDDIEDLTAASGKVEDRIAQSDTADSGQTAGNEEVVAVAPRKVRTMIVKSDGTLVPREETVVEPEAVVANTTPAAPEQSAAAALRSTDDPGSTGSVPASLDRTASEPRAAKSNMPDSIPVAPTRPADQPVDIVGEVKPDQVAAVAPSVQTAATGAWSMQIASQPSEDAAQTSYRNLSRRYASVLGGRPANIVKADIAGKGTYWRVRIPADSRADAIKLCESYKSAGGNCFVSK